MYWFLKFIPKNHFSAFVGELAHMRLPFGLSKRIIRWFIKRYKVELDDVEEDLSTFETLGDFFTRKLKSEARPVGEGVVSPVDGEIVQFGKIEEEKILQVKGKHYNLENLLRSKKQSAKFKNGYYITFYLAPRDYHRVHSPVGGGISDCYSIEGKLWPVNTWSVNHIEELFSVNERIISVLQTENSSVAVVKVGATNVGAIALTYDTISGNQNPRLKRKAFHVLHRTYSPPLPIDKGNELGRFRLGSTVVLLFEADSFKPAADLKAGEIKFGQTIGNLR